MLQNIAIVLTVLGIKATVLFHVCLKSNLLEETPSMKTLSESSDSRLHESPNRLKRSWLGWELLLRVAMLYVSSRLFITLATVYLPLYIEEADVGGKQALATVPLASYLSSFAAALLLKYINRTCGAKVLFNFNHLLRCVTQLELPLFSGVLSDWWTDWHFGSCSHGIRRKQRVCNLLCGSSYWHWQFHYYGNGVERHCRSHWTEN